MQTKRLDEFNQHRAKVLKAHLVRDKTYLATRSKRRRQIALGAFQISIGTLAVLAVFKSLMLATNSPSEYARIIAPVVQALDAEHPIATALRPDSLTLTLAEVLRPALSDAMVANMAYGPPMAPDTAATAVTPES